MDANRYQQIKNLVLAAAPYTGAQRSAMLADACRSDVALRHEVEQILRNEESVTAFLEAPVVHESHNFREVALPNEIGGYEIQRLLAAGGMGRVYEAVQTKPRRNVALKVMQAGLTSQSAQRRFEYEADVLARLKHPAIAQIYEAGIHENATPPIPFFAMELVPDAQPITAFAKDRGLSTRKRIELFLRVCDAAQHGHQHGIIHRDLKPANVLVDGDGRVKVIDFGVARAARSDADATLQTQAGQLVGTLQYMSPEQIEADPDAIDTRSDVYALGVLLYELLSGELPYRLSGLSLTDATRQIREQTPPPLRSQDRVFDRDLQNIVAQALAKEPDRRYQSAEALQTDLRRYLEGYPVAARTPTLVYQLSKLARRHLGWTVGAATTLMVLIAGLIAVSLLYANEQAAREQAVVAQKHAEQQTRVANAVNDFLNNDILAAADPANTTDPDITVREAVDNAADAIAARFATEPLIAAALHATLGRVYLNLSAHAQAEAQFRAGHALRVQALGADHLETLALLDGISSALERQGRFEEALVQQAQAVERATAVAPNDPLLPKILSNLGLIYNRLGRYDESLTAYERGMELAERSENSDPESVIEQKIGVGFVHLNRGEYDAAEPLLVNALDARKTLHGSDHPLTLYARSNVALVYTHQGRLREAAEEYQAVLVARKRIHKPDHRALLQARNDYAVALGRLGNTQDAEPELEMVASLRHAKYGPRHPDTLSANLNLAEIYKRNDKLAQSEDLFREVLAGRAELFGRDHPLTLTTIDSLSRVLAQVGKQEEAVELIREAITLRTRTLGADHPQTISSRGGLASALSRAGQLEDALEIHEDVLKAKRRVLGDDHPDTLISTGNVARLLYKLKRYDEAAPLLQETYDGRVAAYGDKHPWSIFALLNLAKGCRMQGRTADARQHYKALWEQYREKAGETSTKTCGAALTYGELSNEVGEYREAETALHFVLANATPDAQRTIGFAHYQLARALQKRGHREEAKIHAEEAQVALTTAHGSEHAETQAAAQLFVRLNTEIDDVAAD